jgi:DNA-binding NarL/FixJ family response regulator
VIRVLLIDDHPVVRTGYKRLLLQEPGLEVVAEATNADEGYQAFQLHLPDVTVTDVSMPGAGGLSLLEKILQRQADAKVLVCSMYDSPQLVQRALDHGAQGFVSKNAEPEELVRAVKAVYIGQQYLSQGLHTETSSGEFALESQRIASLSTREYEIFRLLALGHTIAECADALFISQKTVSNNQTQIKEKLHLGTMTALVHLAQRHQVIEVVGS